MSVARSVPDARSQRRTVLSPLPLATCRPSAHGRRTASFDGVDRKPRPAVEDGGVAGGGQDRGAALVFLDAADDRRGDQEVPECPPLEDERAVAWLTGHRSRPRAARAPRNSGRYTAKGLARAVGARHRCAKPGENEKRPPRARRVRRGPGRAGCNSRPPRGRAPRPNARRAPGPSSRRRKRLSTAEGVDIREHLVNTDPRHPGPGNRRSDGREEGRISERRVSPIE